MTKFSKILVEVEVQQHRHGELTKHEQLEQNPNPESKTVWKGNASAVHIFSQYKSEREAQNPEELESQVKSSQNISLTSQKKQKGP